MKARIRTSSSTTRIWGAGSRVIPEEDYAPSVSSEETKVPCESLPRYG
jgi:hypothetical protein